MGFPKVKVSMPKDMGTRVATGMVTGIPVSKQQIRDVTGQTDRQRAKENYGRASAERDTLYGAQKGYNTQMDRKDRDLIKSTRGSQDAYKAARDPYLQEYQGRLQEFDSQLQNQSKDASATYSNSIKPGLTTLMQQAQRDAAGAMSLEQASDPNNAVAKNVRSMYDQQAQNYGKQGMADAGILQAMGAQSAASQMGAMGPMTTGGMQSLFAASQGQAGQAFARTQQQMQALREQGIAQGFNETDKAYNRGVDAQGRAAGAIGNVAQAERDQFDTQGRIRGERGSIASDRMGVGVGQARENMDMSQGLAGMKHGLGTGGIARNAQTETDYRQGNIAGYGQQAAANNATAEGKAKILTGGLGTAGAIVGGIYGGPAGAAGGQAAGQAAGGSINPGGDPNAQVPNQWSQKSAPYYNGNYGAQTQQQYGYRQYPYG